MEFRAVADRVLWSESQRFESNVKSSTSQPPSFSAGRSKGLLLNSSIPQIHLILTDHKGWRGLTSQYRINVVQCKHAHRRPSLDGCTANVWQKEFRLEHKIPRINFC